MSHIVPPLKGPNTKQAVDLNANTDDATRPPPQRPHSPHGLTQRIRFWLGYRAYWNGRFERAYRLLEPLAHLGHSSSQYYIARMSARGEGVERDFDSAIRWWNASAGAGEPWSQVAIGSLYERGIGVARDRSKALKWYLKAAHSGLPEAQIRVGYFYDCGIGVERDLVRARRWYVEATANGHVPREKPWRPRRLWQWLMPVGLRPRTNRRWSSRPRWRRALGLQKSSPTY